MLMLSSIKSNVVVTWKVDVLLHNAGMSLITNIVIPEHDSEEVPPNHKEVMETAHMRAADMRKLVKCVIEKLSQAESVLKWTL